MGGKLFHGVLSILQAAGTRNPAWGLQYSALSVPDLQHSVWGEKNTSFDSILQRLYLAKKKSLFPGREQRAELEPGKLLLIHAKLHT